MNSFIVINPETINIISEFDGFKENSQKVKNIYLLEEFEENSYFVRKNWLEINFGCKFDY